MAAKYQVLCTPVCSIGLLFASPSSGYLIEISNGRCRTYELNVSRSACNAAPQFDGLMASERLLPCPVNWARSQSRMNVIAEITATDRDKERKIIKKIIEVREVAVALPYHEPVKARAEVACDCCTREIGEDAEHNPEQIMGSYL